MSDLDPLYSRLNDIARTRRLAREADRELAILGICACGKPRYKHRSKCWACMKPERVRAYVKEKQRRARKKESLARLVVDLLEVA